MTYKEIMKEVNTAMELGKQMATTEIYLKLKEIMNACERKHNAKTMDAMAEALEEF